MAERVWRVADPIQAGAVADLEVWPQPLRQLLYNRGLRSAGDVERFLYPERDGMHDPFLLRGMNEAVDRITRAVCNGEMIGVYGDFDVDGLTGVALLVEVLKAPPFQARVVSYLPHRTREGYGLNAAAVSALAQKGVRLLITVDCGVGADEEIRLAGELGMDVIVTDHHFVPKEAPRALVVLNPKQEGCRYPFKELAGVGVVYKLAEALLASFGCLETARQRLERQLDLVALGTVADLVPLLGENRLMVKLGLQQINRRNRPGLRALASAAGYVGRAIDAEGVAYGLAPRLNAAGRMDDARPGLELLLAVTEGEAVRLAAELEEANRMRQCATLAALNNAREDLSRLPELPPAIVLAGDYPAGVVGLVAGKLAEELFRPSFVLELGQFECRGSGRGVPGFNVIQALTSVSQLLVRFGGHAQAGGFTVRTADLEALKENLQSAAAEQIGPRPAQPELYLEAMLSARDIGPRVYQQLQLLEPFGAGNQRPLFYSQRMQVRSARVVGSGHLKLWLADDSGTASAIGFKMATEEYRFASPGAVIDCAYTIGRNEYGGTIGYEMLLRDLRPSYKMAVVE